MTIQVPSETVETFSLQGAIYSAIRNGSTGKPGPLTWLGNCQEARIELSPQISDKYESFTGARNLYARLMKEKKGTVTMTLDEWTKENLALALYNSVVPITGASVSAEVMPLGLVVGSVVALANPFISAVVVHDSAGSPATLVLNTDYKVLSTNRGLIQILNLGAYTQPFTVNYTYANATQIAMMMAATPPERYLVFDGINTMTGDGAVVDLFRVQFNPTKQFGLIDPDFGTLALEGVVLFDSVNANSSNLSGFGTLRSTETAI